MRKDKLYIKNIKHLWRFKKKYHSKVYECFDNYWPFVLRVWHI